MQQAFVPPAIESPQIGILCIDVAKCFLDADAAVECGNVRSYIAVSYVRFLESVGADVIPIWLGRDRKYYEDLLSKLNGVLIPGGAVFFLTPTNCKLPNECVLSAEIIMEIATAKNASGTYFPIWGTCLGMQLMLYHNAIGKDRHEIRSLCEDMNCSLPISFKGKFRNSKLFAKLTDEMVNVLENESFGYHYHTFCITQDNLHRFQLNDDWMILAVNQDTKGLEFATFVEHKRYPFYGCQVHLERVEYEDCCSYTQACCKATQFFAKFFVAECKKSPNRFESKAESDRHSIWNFKPKATHHISRWRECFLFYSDTEYPSKDVFSLE